MSRSHSAPDLSTSKTASQSANRMSSPPLKGVDEPRRSSTFSRLFELFQSPPSNEETATSSNQDDPKSDSKSCHKNLISHFPHVPQTTVPSKPSSKSSSKSNLARKQSIKFFPSPATHPLHPLHPPLPTKPRLQPRLSGTPPQNLHSTPSISRKPILPSGTTNTNPNPNPRPTSTSTYQHPRAPPSRPPLPTRTPTTHTRYISLLLDLDTIPRSHNILASFSLWILLAGFLIFPGTFTSLSSSLSPTSINNITNAADPGAAATAAAAASITSEEILHHVKNVYLLVIAWVCTGIGALGMCWLWWKHRGNCVWLLNRIFLPGVLNGFAGLISTLVNVYTQQGGSWSVSAKETAGVTGGVMVVCGWFFGIYNFGVLRGVKGEHEREMGDGERGVGEEGVWGVVERKMHEPGMGPGSVV